MPKTPMPSLADMGKFFLSEAGIKNITPKEGKDTIEQWLQFVRESGGLGALMARRQRQQQLKVSSKKNIKEMIPETQ